MAEHNEIGKQGEEIARKYLAQRGYRIQEQNYKTKRGEIDLVAYLGKTLVCVEVRTKQCEQFGTPEDTITFEKKNKLLKNAQAYAHYTNHKGHVRIDAICVVLGNKDYRVTHYENAVEN